MARYRATLELEWTPETVFSYLSDFANAQEWDPGVVHAERLDERHAGLGARFLLVARFLGRRAELVYRTIEYDNPSSVTFVGENETAIARDRITLSRIPQGTRLTYDAHLRLKGLLRLADPLLRIAFKRTGNQAKAGLRHALQSPESWSLDPAA